MYLDSVSGKRMLFARSLREKCAGSIYFSMNTLLTYNIRVHETRSLLTHAPLFMCRQRDLQKPDRDDKTLYLKLHPCDTVCMPCGSCEGRDHHVRRILSL